MTAVLRIRSKMRWYMFCVATRIGTTIVISAYNSSVLLVLTIIMRVRWACECQEER